MKQLTTTNTKRPAARSCTYRGRRVPGDVVAAAEMLLWTYNDATGREVGARSADGAASPTLKQIIGALLSRPEVSTIDWTRAVRAVVANPPGWCDGRTPQIGDVFGERAAGHALCNTGVRARRRDDPAKAARMWALTAQAPRELGA